MANSKLNELLNSVVVAIGEIAQEHKENSNSLVKQYNELRSNMKIEHDKQNPEQAYDSYFLAIAQAYNLPKMCGAVFLG